MPDDPARSEYLSIAETARAIGCSVATVRRMLSRGELEGSRLSMRIIRVRRDSLERELRRRTMTAPDR